MRRISITGGRVVATVFGCAIVAVFVIAHDFAADPGSLARAHPAAPEASAPERDVQPPPVA